MILADTSVWIDHFRQSDSEFSRHLEEQHISMHPLVLAELMLGGLPRRMEIIRDFQALPAVVVASPEEVLTFIDREQLSGSGIGYVDAALLASSRLQPGTRLWTRDRRLAALASEMSIAFEAS